MRDLRVSSARLGLVVAQQLAGLHAGGARGVEFGADVRQEQYGFARQIDLAQDREIRIGFALAADARIEIARKQRRQITVRGVRSEEHTSELQSLMRISYAVFCLK